MFIENVQFYCGVVVHCGDCGSSNSDITEPCSPLSTTSLEEMPPTQSQPSWLWGSDAGDPPSKRPKQGKITEYFKTKAKKASEKPASTVKQLISKLLSSPPGTPKPASLPFDDTEVYRDSPSDSIIPPTPPATSPDTSSDASILSVNKCEIENGDISLLFRKTDRSDQETEKDSEEKEERTIRFPPRTGWTGHYVSDVVCKWTDCEAKFATTSSLIEHLQIKHVNTQTMDENYVCRWVNCKVFGRTSCSRTWLERHVLSHGGNKPYRCIVDGCGQRFSSQTLLQRHVNSHFTENKEQGSSKKGCESASKLIRRNGKKLRIRSHPFSARIYDYFDAGIMEGLQHNLIEITERRTQGLFDSCPGDTVTLHSKILGRRIDDAGQVKVLLRWFPSQILSDEWVDASNVDRIRHVTIGSLPSQSKDCLYRYLVSKQRLRRTLGRKPSLTTATST